MLDVMSNCLVTGASGFVGTHLARTLATRGDRVRCLVRGTSRTGELEALDVELVRGDLDDAESLRRAAAGVDVVYHVAGRTAALRASQYMQDNAEGTRRVAEACRAQSTPPALLMVSSLAAGGPGTFKQPRRETDAEQPVSAYGRSKLAAEQAATAFAADVPLSIVRPPMVFGQADRNSFQLFRSMRFLPVHASPGFRRFPLSLIHIADLCDALVRVADHGARVDPAAAGPEAAARGKYYVAADRAVSYGELGQLAARAAGWTVAPLPLPRPIFWVAGTLGEVVGRIRQRPSLVNIDKVREATARGWVCSDEKIRDELGYRPGATLEDRFAETVAWYREHGWL
jgi:nucleoside-diphosphate-sugar epimerase